MPCRTRRGGLEPEAWGIVSLEAQACGLPVVVGRSGGAPETVHDASRGRVVEDAAQLRTALLDLLAPLEGLDGPGRCERRRTRTASTPRWTWDGAAARLADLLA